MLKNRIEDNQKISDNIPNWPENKYDENNENVVVGDSGSVIERLIKAGKFTYDEENMCVNKVVKTKNLNSRNNNDDIDGDSKFKTISSMNIEKNKFRKITDYDTNPKSPEIKKKKKNVHFQESINLENQKLYNSPNPKKSKLKKISKPIEDDDIKEKKEENEKEEKEEEEDWYKEIEELIDLESRRASEKITTKKIKKALRGSKTSNLNKKKENDNKNIISDFEIETEGIENKYLSNHNSNATLKKVTSKKQLSKFSTNAPEKKKEINKTKSTKIIKRDTKKILDDVEDSSKSNKNMNSNKLFKTAKSSKIKQIIRSSVKSSGKRERENSEGKKEKNTRSNKFKKINVDKDDSMGDEGKRRNQSAQKRKIKIKI